MTLPDSKLAEALETPAALELSPLPWQDLFQHRSAAEDWARQGLNGAGPATGEPQARQLGWAESCLCPASVQPCLNFSLARSKRNRGDLGLVQASFLCSPRPQMQRGERQQLQTAVPEWSSLGGPWSQQLLSKQFVASGVPCLLGCDAGRGK